ncbi:hypothetical protein [Sorangium sp. So ce341]|uniref:Uncharacterized protein n=1 Tax=Sorangium cellulosum TaxID=56 RepID=A0A150TC08_SORCE|nr:hypothetical protein BE21_55355 [Sorangium cellulosum]
MDIEDSLVDFYNGAHALDVVAAWAYVVANRRDVLERLASFEKAYERLIELHAAGKIGVGTADFSAGNLELVKRVNRLIAPGFDSDEARQSAQEIHALAERCVRALKESDTSPAGQGGQ